MIHSLIHRQSPTSRLAVVWSALIGLGLLACAMRSNAGETNQVESSGTNLPVASAVVTNETAASTKAETPDKTVDAQSSETKAPTNPSSGTRDFASFKLIGERNIFNPNRSSRSARDRGAEAKPVRSESFTLVGTMSYEKGNVAFFDSSESKYRKALKVHESIADYKLTHVEPDLVKIERDGKTFQLTVGAQMKRREDAPWEMVESPRKRGADQETSAEDADVLARLLKKREEDAGGQIEPPAAPASAETTAVKPAEISESTASDEGDEILKRLLQKRNEEVNK